MQEQVVVIFAGTRGYLDAIPVSAVRKFEDGVLSGLRAEKSILSTIATEKKLSADTEKKLIEFLDKYAKTFTA
jgi:F-type H+-transporting ATPase subunit alpha